MKYAKPSDYYREAVKMPCRITDGPQSHPEGLDIPDGHTVIDELSHKLSEGFLTDEAMDGDPCFILTAISLAMQGDDTAAAEVLRIIHRRAGESDAAISRWIEEKEWAAS